MLGCRGGPGEVGGSVVVGRLLSRGRVGVSHGRWHKPGHSTPPHGSLPLTPREEPFLDGGAGGPLGGLRSLNTHP